VKYAVRWTRKARLQQLAQVWLNAPDRNAVTAAANEVDRLLAANPSDLGESRAGGLRVLIVEPLIVGYIVFEDDLRVIVFSIRYFGPRV
jgi:hypothetical protein